MSTRATEPTIFSTITPDSLIRFKYSGGSTPGRVRTVRFVSWFWAWGERQGYLQAYDSNGAFKTYHYSKMSLLYVLNAPEQESVPETTNSMSNWTSWIKQGDIIEFTYMDQTYVRNVKFVKFMNRNCTPKRKILCYEDLQHGGYTKTFFIDKMTIHKISGVDEEYDSENSVSSPQELHNEIKHLESKQELLIKEMKAHIDSQNSQIQKFKERMFLLEEDCVHLEEEKQKAYTIMAVHKRRYPTTWESDFVPKELSGWEVINPPTSH